MPPVVQAADLGKRYELGTRRALDWLPGRRAARARDLFWALQGVSFEVAAGEVIGLIGRNGAGKSTLLKILARITEPSTGWVELRGRVGSLLEVGTGFHAELTGRDNVYLSGAILGLKRAEITRRFDEIVAFAEVERLIDTPVKRYSSGTYLRLAFAVAAHLEPEILLVDEVLAVGDAAFQRKCLGRMGDFAREGRTVLFVSHNLAAVGRLCSRALLLEGGRLAASGETAAVIARYTQALQPVAGERSWDDSMAAPGDEYLRVASIVVRGPDGQATSAVAQDSPFTVEMRYRVLAPMANANVGFELRGDSGTVAFWTFDADHPEWAGRGRAPGIYHVRCTVPGHLLNEGTFFVSLLGGIPFVRLCLREEDVLRLTVGPPARGEGAMARLGAPRAGLFAPELKWEVERIG
jgi:lipopolysaccharide transport system ATP-binding protein